MIFIYNTGLYLYYLAILISSLFNKKAKLFISGRKDLFSKIKSQLNRNEKIVWFHSASLGEFEQGRPVIEAFKRKYPDYKIVLTFFSPSGYEIRKNYQGADYIFYLPFDFNRNAYQFIELINPKIVFFIKYEFWNNYLKCLHSRNIPVYLFSANFRENQVFFKWYGQFYRNILKYFTHIFVQNENSKMLLTSIGIDNVSVSGDTRFDRVFEITEQVKPIPLIEKFIQGNFTIIAGSTWEKDEDFLSVYINAHAESKPIKYIIAPHEIKASNINRILASIQTKVIRFSEATEENIADKNVIVIDNIGMLSSLYQYGNIAYIGGGFGKGIHNTLEAATFGNPVIFGSKYDKFQEAKDLIKLEAAFSIENYYALKTHIDRLFSDDALLQKASKAARNYVEKSRGSTEKIMSLIEGSSL